MDDCFNIVPFTPTPFSICSPFFAIVFQVVGKPRVGRDKVAELVETELCIQMTEMMTFTAKGCSRSMRDYKIPSAHPFSLTLQA